ncbi:MAG: hypothetical protein JWQ54_2227 [Mucilaginibacter sp.]|nr:hypothetical protein [Mucilaginibacter sp.]
MINTRYGKERRVEITGQIYFIVANFNQLSSILCKQMHIIE